MRISRNLSFQLMVVFAIATTCTHAQGMDPVPLKNWAAPLYWQPTLRDPERAAKESVLEPKVTGVGAITPPLVFVGMTPCRIVDTRSGSGFTGSYGPPSLSGGASRTFPIQSNPSCSIPRTAAAYSFNVTVVPSGPLGYITVYPTGQPLPLAATLNSLQGYIVANAAVVAAGTNFSVDVYATNNTDLIIDINGYYALPTDLGGNTALGYGVLQNNTGIQNTATGDMALNANTSGDANTAYGGFALLNNTTGQNNTASGAEALESNTTGSINTASGVLALFNNTTGSGNTASGYSALGNNNTGNQNTASGFNALGHNQTGNNNIAIGFQAATNVSSGNSNNIHIGSQGSSTDSGAISIGTPGTQTSFFAAGIRGVTTSNNDAITVVIDSAGQLGTVSSSRRYKEDIQDMGDASSGLMRLRPVTFRYTKPYADGAKPIQYGLIAEEVEKVFPDLVARSADGEVQSVKYQLLDPLLLNEVQRQQTEINSQREQLRELKQQLDELRAALARQ